LAGLDPKRTLFGADAMKIFAPWIIEAQISSSPATAWKRAARSLREA
jgi:hypothetical protein